MTGIFSRYAVLAQIVLLLFVAEVGAEGTPQKIQLQPGKAADLSFYGPGVDLRGNRLSPESAQPDAAGESAEEESPAEEEAEKEDPCKEEEPSSEDRTAESEHETSAKAEREVLCKQREALSPKEKAIEEARDHFFEVNPGLVQAKQSLLNSVNQAAGSPEQKTRTIENINKAETRLVEQAKGGGEHDVKFKGDVDPYNYYSDQYGKVLGSLDHVLQNQQPTRHEVNGVTHQNVSRLSLVEQASGLIADSRELQQGGTDTCAGCQVTRATLASNPAFFADFVDQTLFSEYFVNPTNGQTYRVPYESIRPRAGDALAWTYNTPFGYQSPVGQQFTLGSISAVSGRTYTGNGGQDAAFLDRFYSFTGGNPITGDQNFYVFSPTVANGMYGRLEFGPGQAEAVRNYLNTNSYVGVFDPFSQGGGVQGRHATGVLAQYETGEDGRSIRVAAHLNTNGDGGKPVPFVPLGQVDVRTAPGGPGSPGAGGGGGLSNLFSQFPFLSNFLGGGGGGGAFAPAQPQRFPQAKPTPAKDKNAKDKSIDSLSEDTKKKNINGFFEDKLGEAETTADPAATTTPGSNTSSTSSATSTDVNGMFDSTDEAQGAESNTAASASAEQNSNAVNQDGEPVVGEPIVASQPSPVVSSTPVPASTPSETQGLEF